MGILTENTDSRGPYADRPGAIGRLASLPGPRCPSPPPYVGFLSMFPSFALGFGAGAVGESCRGLLGCLGVSPARPWPAFLQPNTFLCKQDDDSICVTGRLRTDRDNEGKEPSLVPGAH